jgi:hypothetical protein
MGYMMVVPDNGGSLYPLDDGFTSNGIGMRYGNGFDHVVRGWHFNDLLNMFNHIIRNIVWFLNMDRFVDSVDFFLNFDKGCSKGLGAFKSGGDGNFEVWDSGLQDLGGVTGNVLSLSQVNLFGDDGCGFVEGGHIGVLGDGDMGSRKGDESGFVSNIGGGLRNGGADFGADSSSGRDNGLSTMGSSSGGKSTSNRMCGRGKSGVS